MYFSRLQMAAKCADSDHLSQKFLRTEAFELLGCRSRKASLLKIDLKIKGL
jgi:hypothetical protein